MARVSTEVWAPSTPRPASAMSAPGRPGLLFSLGREIHVPPAGEAVLEVPLALAVAEQDEGPHGRGAYRAGATGLQEDALCNILESATLNFGYTGTRSFQRF